jgi:hypothetical protein
VFILRSMVCLLFVMAIRSGSNTILRLHSKILLEAGLASQFFSAACC